MHVKGSFLVFVSLKAATCITHIVLFTHGHAVATSIEVCMSLQRNCPYHHLLELFLPYLPNTFHFSKSEFHWTTMHITTVVGIAI